MVELIIKKVRHDLKKNLDPAYKRGSLNFFKEPIKLYGVRAKTVEQIAKHYFKEVNRLPKEKILAIVGSLFKSNYNEEFAIGSSWLYQLVKYLNKGDFPRLCAWLKNYITNWAMCDDYCSHPLGYLIYRYPKLLQQTKIWTKSPNRWIRRAAAVVHIHPTKQQSLFKKNILRHKSKYLKNVFQIANLLKSDQDDLVQKGYGWMLKEASNLFPQDVFNYVMKNKNKMSRTALRYAIEKLPTAWKKAAMN